MQKIWKTKMSETKENNKKIIKKKESQNMNIRPTALFRTFEQDFM